MTASDLLLWGIVIHLVVDWLLQNDWMAQNKVRLRHPAAWVHSGLHFLGLLLIFQPITAWVIATIHLLIDTRAPLAWWRNTYRQTQEGAIALHVSLWADQVLHIAIIALAALLETAI